MKRFNIIFVIILGLVFLDVPAFAGMDDSWHLVFNTQDFRLSVGQPVIEKGRSLVPIDDLVGKIGFTYDYNADKEIITIKKGSNILSLTIEDVKAVINSEEKDLDVVPRHNNGKIYVPLRFIAEELGYNVCYHRWGGYTPMIWITEFDLISIEEINDKGFILRNSDSIEPPFYSLKPEANTMRGIKFGDSLDKVKKVYGSPFRENLNNENTGVIMYTTVFLPDSGSGARLSFVFEKGALKKAIINLGT